MTRNITDILERVLLTSFDVGQAELVLKWLASELEDSEVDWDQGAGESWGRVIAGGRVGAFVWMKGPLAIVVAPSEAIVKELGKREVAVIPAVDMDATCFTSERSVVEALAGRPVSDAFEHTRFSAEDLVWATI